LKIKLSAKKGLLQVAGVNLKIKGEYIPPGDGLIRGVLTDFIRRQEKAMSKSVLTGKTRKEGRESGKKTGKGSSYRKRGLQKHQRKRRYRLRRYVIGIYAGDGNPNRKNGTGWATGI